MTELTDVAVKAMIDGATPGPWRADGEPWNRVVWSSADNRVCFMAHSNGMDDERDIATSELVAAAPSLARALLDARADLAAAQQREAEWAIAAVAATCDAEIEQAKKLGPMHVPIIIALKHDCIAAIRAALSNNGRGE